MEDFVSFEMAKKLKEKGFSWICSHYYRTKSKDLFMIFPCEDWSNIEERVNAPAIPQVLKWLREEKKVHIIIPASFDEGYWWEVIGFNREILKYSVVEYTSYEEAAVEGIGYVLDNLI